MTDYFSLGASDPSPRNLYSYSANGTISKLVGRHTFKMGVDYRTIGIDTQSFSGGAGVLNFDRRFTSSDANANGTGGTTPSGNGLATMLLGYPSGDPGNLSRILVSSPANYFARYYGGYFQDDFRVSSRFTLNAGLRIEHEDGLREEENRFTVAFDRTLNPGGALGAAGARGGLVYAGVNGAPTQQGNQPTAKFSPRVGFVYSADPKTVLRGGYGIYQAPWNYQFVGATNYGQVGYSQNTFMVQDPFRPTANLTNPFPAGVVQPRGNSFGALEGVGSNIEFIDQDKKAPYVQQYSLDVVRELPGNMAIGFEYNGATGRQLGLGGSNDGILNINQLDPRHLSLGAAALNAQVPNPYAGLLPGTNLNGATYSRAQSLRPFPQFGNITMRQSTSGKNQYHAAILKLDKRMSHGWGGRINYTYSRLKDNQFGEGNAYSATNGNIQNVYDLDAEYQVGLLDVPHKVALSPTIELPFGEGKKWATGGVGAAILGDWTITSIIAFESGFPMSVANNSNTLTAYGFLMQRPNLTGSAIETTGNREERLYAPPVSTATWLDPNAFANPGLALGTAPRTYADVRTPHRNNWDFVAAKDVRLGGSRRAQIKFEVLNITNTVKADASNTSLGAAAFARVARQRGFMRLTQLMFRLSF
jgi:hypothetical protein